MKHTNEELYGMIRLLLLRVAYLEDVLIEEGIMLDSELGEL